MTKEQEEAIERLNSFIKVNKDFFENQGNMLINIKTYKEWCKELEEKENIRIFNPYGFINIENFNENMKFTKQEFVKRLSCCTIISC